MIKILFFALATFFSFSSLQAKELQGVNYEDSIKIGEKTLVLNGMGLRKATILRIKVYVAGLYTDKKYDSSALVLASSEPKKVLMQFLMGLDKEKLTDAWNNSLREHCPKDCSNIISGIGKINSYMRNVGKGDKFEFVIHKDKVESTIKGDKKDDIMGEDFANAFLSVFIGPKEIDEGMAKGLLGKD